MKWPIKNLLPKGQTRMPGVGKNKKVKSEVKASTELDNRTEWNKLSQEDKDQLLENPLYSPTYYGLFKNDPRLHVRLGDYEYEYKYGDEWGEETLDAPPIMFSENDWKKAYQNIQANPFKAFSYEAYSHPDKTVSVKDEGRDKIEPLMGKIAQYENSDIYKERIAAAKYYDEVDLNKWMQDPSYRQGFVKRYAQEDPKTFYDILTLKRRGIVNDQNMIPAMSDASDNSNDNYYIYFNP